MLLVTLAAVATLLSAHAPRSTPPATLADAAPPQSIEKELSPDDCDSRCREESLMNGYKSYGNGYILGTTPVCTDLCDLVCRGGRKCIPAEFSQCVAAARRCALSACRRRPPSRATRRCLVGRGEWLRSGDGTTASLLAC